MNFSWLLYEFNLVYEQRAKYGICHTITAYEVQTFKNKGKRKLLRGCLYYERREDKVFVTCI